MSQQNRFYVVRNLVGSGGCTEIASGIIPATSPALYASGVDTQGTYKLMKGPIDAQAPTGASVIELDSEEAKLSVQSELFSGGAPTVPFIQREQVTARDIAAEFMAAQSALSVAAGDALLTLLEPTSHALTSGSLNIAYSRFNASGVDQATKDAFNPLFENFFQKYPRNLT